MVDGGDGVFCACELRDAGDVSLRQVFCGVKTRIWYTLVSLRCYVAGEKRRIGQRTGKKQEARSEETNTQTTLDKYASEQTHSGLSVGSMSGNSRKMVL